MQSCSRTSGKWGRMRHRQRPASTRRRRRSTCLGGAPASLPPRSQYLSTVNGTLTTVDPTTIVTSFNNATGLCSNAIRYVNITFYYSITDTSAQQTPGYINAVRPGPPPRAHGVGGGAWAQACDFNGTGLGMPWRFGLAGFGWLWLAGP